MAVTTCFNGRDMQTVRIIKKYPNRRLYDTELRCYITLDDVKELVLEQVELKIVDAKTNKDLTQSTLLQIIAEQEETMTPIFTTGLLQQFIRFYHAKSKYVLSDFLEQAMQFFTQQKEMFQNPWMQYLNLFIDKHKNKTKKTEKPVKTTIKKPRKKVNVKIAKKSSASKSRQK